jgi:hypothetical protein
MNSISFKKNGCNCRITITSDDKILSIITEPGECCINERDEVKPITTTIPVAREFQETVNSAVKVLRDYSVDVPNTFRSLK